MAGFFVTLSRRLSIAPMMKRTDRHCRYFLRLLSKKTLLYSEMITADAIINGNRAKLLDFSNKEHPVALQVGGNNPEVLAEATKIGLDWGYDEINLNVGCPSSRVKSGQFGASLMKQKDLVAKCVEAMTKTALNIPVTIIEAGPCPIVQVKTEKKDGYSAFQLGFMQNKNTNKPISGHFKKNGVGKTFKVLKEFKANNIDDGFSGKEVTVDTFSVGDKVVVTGKSKGKGFAGHMKRHNFGGGRASHGKNSVMRKAGSVGAGTWPGRVWKGTRMAGRMGGENVRVSNLKVVRIDSENNLLFVKGAVPGASKSIIYIRK